MTVNNSRRCSDGDEGVEGPVGAQAPGPPLPPISSTSAQVDAEDSLSPESPPAPGSLIHDRSHESDDVFHRAIAHLERTAQ